MNLNPIKPLDLASNLQKMQSRAKETQGNNEANPTDSGTFQGSNGTMSSTNHYHGGK